MKEKITFGKLLSRKQIIINLGGILIYLLFIFPLCNSISKIYPIIPHWVDYVLMIVVLVVMIVWTLPVISYRECVEFDLKEIRYYHIEGCKSVLNTIVRTILGKPLLPETTINIKDVEEVRLSYYIRPMIWWYKHYQVVMSFLMNDGSIIKITFWSFDQMNQGGYEAALQYLEAQGIKIIDEDELRPILNQGSKYFYEYVQNLSKRKNK